MSMCGRATLIHTASHPFCAGLVPAAHLADGRINLVMVRRCNHVQYLRFLLRLTSCGLHDLCLPYVRVVPVTAGEGMGIWVSHVID